MKPNPNDQTFGRRIWHSLRRYARDRRGNISTMVALLIIPLVGVLGLAAETGNWYTIHRGAQNAADSAVLAAAQTGLINPSGTTYVTTANSVSANLGYTNGLNSTTVTTVNGQACPAPGTGSACYKVTVSRNVPINLIKILGYNGTGGSGTQNVAASAIAGPVDVITNYCILTLGTTGKGIDVNGGPNVDFTGCNLMSNSTLAGNGNNIAVRCSGQNPKAGLVASAGTSDPNCGGSTYSNASPVADPYSHYASDNPSDISDTCAGSPKYPGTTTTPVFTSVTKVCGSLKLTSDVTIPSGTVLVIQNGQLDLNNHNMSGDGVTIVFNTPAGQGDLKPFAEGGGVTGKGNLSISAPETGPWSGVALYQNRQNGSTAVVPQTYNGNAPHWNITGIVYLPKIDLTFTGAVGKYDYNCFVLVANNLQISGTGAIYSNPMSQCIQAGVILPNNIVSSRVALLQ